MLERFWKNARAGKNDGDPIAEDLLAENGKQEADEEKFLEPESAAAAPESGDDAAPEDDVRLATARVRLGERKEVRRVQFVQALAPQAVGECVHACDELRA